MASRIARPSASDTPPNFHTSQPDCVIDHLKTERAITRRMMAQPREAYHGRLQKLCTAELGNRRQQSYDPSP